MKEKRIDDQRFLVVPYMDEKIFISKYGNVFDSSSGQFIKPVMKAGGMYISYNGASYAVAYLVALTFIGKHNADIIFKDGNVKNVRSKNITYSYNVAYVDGTNAIINDEQFKVIPNTNYRYYANEYGVVFDTNYGFIHHSIDKRGYYRTHLHYSKGYAGTNKLNRIVYETYNGKIPDDYIVDHLDGKSWHNHYSNLEAVTFQENVRRAYDSESYGRDRTWTKDQVRRICELMEKGYDIYKISDSLDIDKKDRRKLTDLITRIQTKGGHSDIASQYDISNYKVNRERVENRTSNYEQIRDILKMINEGCTDTMISNSVGIPRIKVYQIRHERVYKEYINRAKEELGI